MDEQAEYSVLSKAAYDYFHGGEALAQSELREYGLGSYGIDDGLSDEHAVVITRPDGSAVVSYRGTDHISDLVPDFQIAMGYHQNKMLQRMGAAASYVASDRFADARSRYTKAKEKYDDVMLTGHSLGGQLALHTARRHGAQFIVFNPGSSPFAEPFHAAMCSAFDCGYTKTQRIYSTGYDPISISSYLFDRATDDVIPVAPKEHGDILSHGLVHFIPRRVTGNAPAYLDGVVAATGERVAFCELFPELCPPGS
jgi:pimeloyl-ACP methyl ester carboxylesterase